MVAVTETVNNI